MGVVNNKATYNLYCLWFQEAVAYLLSVITDVGRQITQVIYVSVKRSTDSFIRSVSNITLVQLMN
jgi:hypothetical protein